MNKYYTKKERDEMINERVEELKQMIDEQREWGNNKVADMFADELQTLLANERLVGNKPRRT